MVRNDELKQDEREQNNAPLGEQLAPTAAASDEDAPEVPRDTWGTVRRLWAESRGQHWRFAVVIVSIVFYTGFSVAAPAYSAHVIDLLWTEIQAAFA